MKKANARKKKETNYTHVEGYAHYYMERSSLALFFPHTDTHKITHTCPSPLFSLVLRRLARLGVAALSSLFSFTFFLLPFSSLRLPISLKVYTPSI